MITDEGTNQPGMLIDDVSIPEIGYASDFESGDGGWQAEGWIRTDNVLPQQVWVQAVQRVGKDISVSRWLAPDRDSLDSAAGGSCRAGDSGRIALRPGHNRAYALYAGHSRRGPANLSVSDLVRWAPVLARITMPFHKFPPGISRIDFIPARSTC